MMHLRAAHRSTMLVALLASPSVSAAAQTAGTAAPYVETAGYGERRVAPDRASVIINVTTKAQTAAAAAAENARIQQRVMDTLRTMGLGNATSIASYNIGRDYEPNDSSGRPRFVTAARTTIRVRLTDIRNVGQVIDASLGRGATGVDGVYLEASTEEALRRAAMADAATAARADAEALARALGGSLGPMLSATSTGATMVGNRDLGEMRLRSGSSNMESPGELVSGMPPFAPSEIVITARVIARWGFGAAK